MDDVQIPIEVIQFDFVQGKFELMLQPKSCMSDLDDLHKSHRQGTLGSCQQGTV